MPRHATCSPHLPPVPSGIARLLRFVRAPVRLRRKRRRVPSLHKPCQKTGRPDGPARSGGEGNVHLLALQLYRGGSVRCSPVSRRLTKRRSCMGVMTTSLVASVERSSRNPYNGSTSKSHLRILCGTTEELLSSSRDKVGDTHRSGGGGAGEREPAMWRPLI